MSDQVTDALKNGNPAGIKIETVNPVVEMLKQAVADAQSGAIQTVGIIAIGPAGNVVTAFQGPNVPGLYFGCGMFMRRFELQAMGVEMHPKQPSPASRIIKPPTGI